MGKDKVICSCYKVTKKDIKNAVANGATSFKTVKADTKVTLGCGHCKKKAKKLVKKYLSKKKVH